LFKIKREEAMKKIISLFVALVIPVVFGLTVSAKAAEMEKKHVGTMEMEGYVIDTKCATANKDKLDEFVKTHGKECAMADACKASGYNLYSDGKLWKFDKKSNAKVAKFLEKADSTLHVKATVTHMKGDNIKLVKIEKAE
jgi:hypothetical protein